MTVSGIREEPELKRFVETYQHVAKDIAKKLSETKGELSEKQDELNKYLDENETLKKVASNERKLVQKN